MPSDIAGEVGAFGVFFASLSVDICLKFSTPGTYNFLCQNHGFKGTIVVN